MRALGAFARFLAEFDIHFPADPHCPLCDGIGWLGADDQDDPDSFAGVGPCVCREDAS